MDAGERGTATSTTTTTQRQVLSRLGVDIRLLDECDERGELTARAMALRNVAGPVERMYLTLSSGGGLRPTDDDRPGDNALSRGLNLAVARAVGEVLREALEK